MIYGFVIYITYEIMKGLLQIFFYIALYILFVYFIYFVLLQIDKSY